MAVALSRGRVLSYVPEKACSAEDG